MVAGSSVLNIYNRNYSKKYDDLYLYPWMKKHKLNIINIKNILAKFGNSNISWLDTCCGQGWHFTQFPEITNKTGIDISKSQIEYAKKRNKDVVFINNDVLQVSIKDNSFDLVTNFWASYCYLNSFRKIESFLIKAIKWIKKGGAIYFEVLLPEDLEVFNYSGFSFNYGFKVSPVKKDYSKWKYSDEGGCHYMTSPPLNFFTEILSDFFYDISAIHDKSFMVHLIASGKK